MVFACGIMFVLALFDINIHRLVNEETHNRFNQLVYSSLNKFNKLQHIYF